jgi:hypothetical protein
MPVIHWHFDLLMIEAPAFIYFQLCILLLCACMLSIYFVQRIHIWLLACWAYHIFTGAPSDNFVRVSEWPWNLFLEISGLHVFIWLNELLADWLTSSFHRAVETYTCSASQEILHMFSNFCRVLNVVCFLLGNSLTSEFYMPMFQNTLFVPSSYPLMKMEQTETILHTFEEHYHVHKSLLRVAVTELISSTHTSCFFKVLFNIILSSMPRSHFFMVS